MVAKNMVKAVGYARRSTDMQERSIPDQQAFVKRWANEHNYAILRWYTDDAISGTSTKGREAFERMIHEAENGRDFEAVLVYDISRFSRGGTNETGFFLYRLQQVGVRVLFCAEALPDDDGGELLLGVKSWQARQYSVKLSRDSIRGAVSAVTVNHSLQGGKAPFGFDKQYQTPDGQVLRTIRNLPDGRKEEFDAEGRHVRFIPGSERLGKVRSDIVRLVPGDPARIEVVRLIFDLCCRGNGVRNTVIELNRRGIPSSTGGKWSRSHVKQILISPFYRGDLAWNRSTEGKIHGIGPDGRPYAKKVVTPSRRNARDHWMVVENVHQPLVTKETWDAAQQEMTRRRERLAHPRACKPYLLGGLIRCRRCGYGFWGVTIRTLRRGQTRYYVDGGFRARGLAACRSTQIRADELEAWVLGKVRDMILGDAETLTAAVDMFVGDVLPKDGGSGDDTAAQEKELAALSKRIRATVAMLADPDLADLEELKATLVELKHRREALETQRTQAADDGEPLDGRALREWATGGRSATGLQPSSASWPMRRKGRCRCRRPSNWSRRSSTTSRSTPSAASAACTSPPTPTLIWPKVSDEDASGQAMCRSQSRIR